MQKLQNVSAGDSVHVRAVVSSTMQCRTARGQTIHRDGAHRHEHLELPPDGEVFATLEGQVRPSLRSYCDALQGLLVQSVASVLEAEYCFEECESYG